MAKIKSFINFGSNTDKILKNLMQFKDWLTCLIFILNALHNQLTYFVQHILKRNTTQPNIITLRLKQLGNGLYLMSTRLRKCVFGFMFFISLLLNEEQMKNNVTGVYKCSLLKISICVYKYSLFSQCQPC